MTCFVAIGEGDVLADENDDEEYSSQQNCGLNVPLPLHRTSTSNSDPAHGLIGPGCPALFLYISFLQNRNSSASAAFIILKRNWEI